MRRASSRRRLYRAALAALVLLSAICAPARDSERKREQARTQFETAERLRETMSAKPAGQRTRQDYKQAIDAYRRVYFLSPGSSKADSSVVAVADLLVEEGRALRDEKALRAAIAQYEFLRREYPGSKYRFDAFFLIGQIYKEDLNDSEKAKQVFQDFLKRYPRQRLAAEARIALQQIEQGKTQRTTASLNSVPPDGMGTPQRARQARDAEVQAKQQRPVPKPPELKLVDVKIPDSKPALPLVTGIRHWSTPDYTRVVIDLESEVQYEAGRVPSPDRIFFDLHGTKLAAPLAGKSFEVADGFLRKIRVGQFQRDMTRVVLEVDDVSDYSAFLLPNPYRLIIDIHGRRQPKSATVIATAGAAASKTQESAKLAEGTKSQPRPPAQPQGAAAANPVQESAKAVNSTPAPPSPPSANATTATAKKKDSGSASLEAPKPPATVKDRSDSQAESNGRAEVTIADKSAEQKATKQPTTKPTFQAVAPRITEKSAKNAAPPVRPAQPTSDGERSLIRALGLKIGRIVVDAGHGGYDTGTIGPNGLQEKDLVLDVSLRLGRLLKSRLGAEVVYTRTDDSFVPLETRTAIANQQQADLFISVHANSSADRRARGVETYYLNFTSSPAALEVAARENAVSEKSIHELQDLVKKIALRDKIEESREFAANIQTSLHQTLAARDQGLRDRGVKKAPFIVLIGANMPSVLAEIAFVSNPADARKLQTPEYRQRIAEALYKGVTKYVGGLSGVKMASRAKDPQGQ